MRCEELEAIVFSGREITAEERAEMEAHAETCEACRALMDNADALRGMQRIDEDVTPPESFTKGWRMAIRQTPRVISISDWMRRKGVRVVGYAACAALVFAAGTGVGRLGGNEKNVARTAYDYDYGAYDTYEAYPQEDAVALYENSTPALGARSAAEKAGDSALKSAAAAERSGRADASQPKERWVATPRAESSATPPEAKSGAGAQAKRVGSSSTRSAPFSSAARARSHLSCRANAPRWVSAPLIRQRT